MNDPFCALHPTGIEHIPVAPLLNVPRMPNPPTRELNRKSVANYYKASILAELRVCGSTESIFVIDKAFPHSRFDVMLLASDDEQKHSSYADLDDATSRVICTLASQFQEYVCQRDVQARFNLADYELHQVYNYSRDTVDRENGQFYDKRFHLHMNCWPENDLRGLTAVPISQVTNAVRRKMIDPLTYLAPRIMRNLLGFDVEGYEIMPVDVKQDIKLRLPPGLKLRLDGWHSLRDPGLPKALRCLHRTADQAYHAIFAALTGQRHAPRAWHREKLLKADAVETNLAAIAWLTDETRELTRLLASRLNDVSDLEMETCRTSKTLASRRLALAGLDYSIGFCEPRTLDESGAVGESCNAGVYVVMQFRLMGDVGSASLPPLRDACMALLNRQDGPVLSTSELCQRHNFITGFLDHALPNLHRSGLAVTFARRA